MDALILPSRAEALPVSVLESASAGVAPIISLAGNLGDYFNENNAFIINEISSSSVNMAIQSFCQASKSEKLSEVQSASKRTWSRFFDVERTTIELTEFWINAFEVSESRLS